MGRLDGFAGEKAYNHMSFTPAEVKKGLHIKFIQNLVEISEELEDCFLDIHLTNDSYCFIVEWTQVPYDLSYGGTFEYVSLNDDSNLDESK